jgi:hypothetical protein
MADITIVKTSDRVLTEVERSALHRLMFGDYVDGFGEQDKSGWMKFWQTVKSLEAGEILIFTFKKLRNYKYHKKFFALLNFAYEMWQPERQHKTYKGEPVSKNFERFRKDVTIQAGFYEQTFDLDGNMQLEALSISFAKMDDLQFEQVYNAVATVILEKVLLNYKDRAELDDVMNEMMGFLK